LPESFVRILSLTSTTAKVQLVSYGYEVDNNNNVNNSGKVSGEPNYVEHVATFVLAAK